MEDDDFVDAVEELGTEVVLQRVHDLVAHTRVAHGFVGLGESDVGLAQILGAEVRRHDDDGVAEVDRTALAVGETTLFENLQQRVEHVGVGLFDFVEQHHAERLAPDSLGQLATFVVTHVAGGRAHQAADRVLLHVLGHVECDECRFVAEQELTQCLGEFGLTHTCGSEEDERTARPLRVLQTGARTADAL